MSGYVDWRNTKVLQKAVLIDAEGNLLAIRRTTAGPAARPGKWDLPGGSISQDDLADDTKPNGEAIRREISEETGLGVVAIKAASVDSWTFERSPGKILGVAIGYRANIEGIQPRIILSDEHTEAIWGTKEDLLALDFGDDGGLHPSIIRAID